jgi:hypothetical protein
MRVGKKKINVGVGFVTGRRHFKNVVKTYVDNWHDSEQADARRYALHLFVAYDLKYRSTKASDYRITDEEILGIIDSAYYYGNAAIRTEARSLVESRVIDRHEAKLLFGEGYAMKRNVVLYAALKNKMDYLVFLDDDEYPIAAMKMDSGVVWRGQGVLSTHVASLDTADMTYGYHCGYISPIPQIEFNEKLSEQEFKVFIEALSNDIVNWASLKAKMEDGGVAYADRSIIEQGGVEEIEEANGMKFISGSNLGFNLENPDAFYPFYNPPGARGEDTFLSTCLSQLDVRKVPCYTFHDGFATYEHLLSGVLPDQLRPMTAASNANTKRFLNACIGWIRYKPLLLYIVRRDEYEERIAQMRSDLSRVLPAVCAYFGTDEFRRIPGELDFYDTHVEEHYQDFECTKTAWKKVVSYLKRT